MKNYLKLLAFILLIFNVFISKAQQNDTLEIQRNIKGIVNFARFRSNSDRKMEKDTLFLKSILQAKNEDGFRNIKESTDELGITHKKFQQYYRGLKVENAEYLIHGKNGIIETINGHFEHVNISSIPSINEQQALKKALDFVNSKKYKWEDKAYENFIKQRTNNPVVTYYPKGELIIAKDYLKGSNNFKLAWKFTISSLIPDNEQWIYIDAISGEVIGNTPLILDVNTSGTAQTLYSQTIGITCDSYVSGYRLSETRNTTSGHSANIHTWNCLTGSNYTNAVEFSNNNTNWVTGNWPAISQDRAALDAHWAEEKILDYWSSVQTRNSLNDQGIDIIGYVHFFIANSPAGWPNNAQWDGTGNVMRYGDGDGVTFNPLTALDIVSHEMGHGINQFTANLHSATNNQESDALNEGFSDIWGACVEHWAAPTKQTWLIAEEIFATTTYNCIRNMQNPKSTTASEGQHPDTYHGTFWDNNGEPHTNSTVLSHWFYLLSQGGSGTNDIGNSYSVNGIGIDVAQKIVYKTESSYLYSSADYIAVRNATIQAAVGLFGANSCQVVGVTNAWFAVGVGAQYQPSLSISGPGIVCSTGTNFTVNNLPSGWSTSWTYSSNLRAVYGGTNFISLVSNGNGTGWVRSTVIAPCGSFILPQFSVWVGTPVAISSLEGEEVGYPNACINELLHLTIIDNNVPSLTNYIWASGGATMTYHNSNYSYVIERVSSVPTMYDFQIKVSNSCGTLPVKHFTGLVQKCGGAQLTLSPNPTSSIVQVSIIGNQTSVLSSDTTSTFSSLTSSSQNGTTYTVNIYNSFGTLLYSTKKTGDKFVISIGSLKDGTYILEANDGKQTYSQQLIIKH